MPSINSIHITPGTGAVSYGSTTTSVGTTSTTVNAATLLSSQGATGPTGAAGALSNVTSLGGSLSIQSGILSDTALVPSNNLSDLKSKATARSNILSVANREPLPKDVYGYYVGSSLWLEPNGQIDYLTRVVNGVADWQPLTGVGNNPGSVVAGNLLASGTRCEVAGYIGGLFDIYNPVGVYSGGVWTPTTTTISALPDGSPDISSLAAALASNNGVGYITKLYDQTGNANHITQTVVANAPKIDLNQARGTNLPIEFDLAYRIYRLNIKGSLTTSSYTGAKLTITGGVPVDILPGMMVPATTANVYNAAFIGGISTNTLTVTSVTSGTIAVGQTIPGAQTGTVITAGSGLSWTVSGPSTQVIASGTSLTALTTISSVDYSQGTITLSVTPTATPGAFIPTINPAVYFDLPASLAVAWQAHSVIASVRYGSTLLVPKFVLLGQPVQVASSNSASWMSMYSGAPLQALAISSGNNGGLAGNITPTLPPSTFPLTIGYSVGGTGGKTVNWRVGGQQGTSTVSGWAPLATNLTGGSVGYMVQRIGTTASEDFCLFDLIVNSSTTTTQVTQSQIQQVDASIHLARGWIPQPVIGIVSDGSSTTYGVGTTSPLAQPTKIAEGLSSFVPAIGYSNGLSSETLELMNWNLTATSFAVTALYDATLRNILVLNPSANSLVQSANNYGVSTVTGAVVTISPGSSSMLPGCLVSASGTGASNLPAGAYIQSINASPATQITIDSAHTPTGTFQYLNLINSTAASEWATLTSYLSTVTTQGYNVVLIGPAARSIFTTAQLKEFRTNKVFMRLLAPSISNVIFIDLEDDPYFGGDSLGGMTVTGVNSGLNQVTVQTLSTYATNGNYVQWAGMPYSISADTGWQNITAVSGNTLTVSGAVTGLSIGSIIYAINPTPWTNYPSVWNPDGQHYTDYGYGIIANKVKTAILANGLLK